MPISVSSEISVMVGGTHHVHLEQLGRSEREFDTSTIVLAAVVAGGGCGMPGKECALSL